MCQDNETWSAGRFELHACTTFTSIGRHHVGATSLRLYSPRPTPTNRKATKKGYGKNRTCRTDRAGPGLTAVSPICLHWLTIHRSQTGTSTAVNMTIRLFSREQCPFVVSTSALHVCCNGCHKGLF